VYSKDIPMSELLHQSSYEEHFMNFKEIVKNGNQFELDKTFMLIEDYFLFSKEYDMMYKKKLHGDIYTSVPMDNLLYPMFLEAVKSKYNDISVMKKTRIIIVILKKLIE